MAEKAIDIAAVYNMDIAAIVRKVDVVISELCKSQSSPVSEFREADMARIKKYIDAAKHILEHVESDPELDLPRWHPTAIGVGPEPTLPDMGNECLRDIVMLWIVFRHSLVSSNSALQPTGLTNADMVRATAVITKMENYITNVVEELGPIDTPEHAQTAPMPEV